MNVLNGWWVCTPTTYAMLLAQGYVTAIIETRHGIRWRFMVLP